MTALEFNMLWRLPCGVRFVLFEGRWVVRRNERSVRGTCGHCATRLDYLKHGGGSVNEGKIPLWLSTLRHDELVALDAWLRDEPIPAPR